MILIRGIFLVLCGLIIAHPAKAQEAPKPVPVLVETVSLDSNSRAIEVIGTSRALRSVTLYSDAEGRIQEFPARQGGAVEAGEIILRLDDERAKLAVAFAQSQLKAAETSLERARRLNETRVRSDANVVDAEILREQSRIALAQAQKELADHSLRAPFSGILGISDVEVGARITPSQPLITLDDRSNLIVEFQIAERYYADIKKGHEVLARTPALPGRDIKGYIDRIDSRIDPETRTVLVRAILPNPEDELLAGLSFMVRLQVDGPDHASIPELALQWEDGQSYVWRIKENKAERVPVISKRRLNQKILIEGDITPGELVVVEGVQRLRPGRLVLIAGEGA